MDLIEFLRAEFPEILRTVNGMYYADGIKKVSNIVGFDYDVLALHDISQRRTQIALLKTHMAKYKHLYYLWIL